MPTQGAVVGIDQFIGNEEYLYKGFGALFIKVFIDQLVAQDPKVMVVVDPDPDNAAAIRCYEKVGFEKLGEYQASWGMALVMMYQKK